MQDAALGLAVVGAVLSLANVVMGMISVITGKDHLPQRVRRLFWRVPASAEDHRLRGMAMMLNGAGVMIVELAITATVVAAHGHAFRDAVFFITMLAFLTALTCIAGAYALSLRTRYVSSRASTDPLPGIPPA